MAAVPAKESGGVVIPEYAALRNPSFAEGVADIIDAGGVVSFLYGSELKNDEQVCRFLAESGCRPEYREKIRLIKRTADMTLESLEEQVAASLPSGIKIENVTVMVTPGGFAGNAKNMKVLQLQEVVIGSKKVLLALNAERVAYRVALMGKVPEGSIAIEGIQGLYYNANTKRFTYLPSIVPENIGEEVETYRTAILLLSSAA